MSVKFEKQDDGSIIVDNGAFTIFIDTAGYAPDRWKVTKRCDDNIFVGSLHNSKCLIKNYIKQRVAYGQRGGNWKKHIEHFEDYRELYECDEAKLQRVCEDAEVSFWSTVAEGYPEITTGDLDPGTAFTFGKRVREVVKEWINTNKDCDRCGNRGWVLKGSHYEQKKVVNCPECQVHSDDIEAGIRAYNDVNNKEQS